MGADVAAKAGDSQISLSSSSSSYSNSLSLSSSSNRSSSNNMAAAAKHSSTGAHSHIIHVGGIREWAIGVEAWGLYTRDTGQML